MVTTGLIESVGIDVVFGTFILGVYRYLCLRRHSFAIF